MAVLGAEALEQSDIKEVKDLGEMASNARIGLIDDAEHWEVYLWGPNLADSDHMNHSFRDFLGTYVQVMPCREATVSKAGIASKSLGKT